MDIIDRLLKSAENYRAHYTPDRPLRPALQLAIVACMDSRLDLYGLLGLDVGDAHVLRNAGGVITADTIRSLAISQRRLGTRSVMLIHHTHCGLEAITDEGFKQELCEATGMAPDWAVEAFTDVRSDVRQSLQRVRNNPFLLHRDDVRGFVFHVNSGCLDEVT